MEYVYPVTTGD